MVSNEYKKFRRVCEGLGENERKKAKSYISNFGEVYIAKVVNPKSGKVQYRIELKMNGEFRPTSVVKSSMHLQELKRFVEWLEQHKDYLKALDELNATTKVTNTDVGDF